MMKILVEPLRPFSDFNLFWSVMVQFGIIMSILLLANVMRRRIPILKQSLLPVAVIGGFLGLLIKYLFTGGIIPGFLIVIDETPLITRDVLATFTYHAIAIGFAALTLKGIDQLHEGRVRQKANAVKSGMVIVNSYLLQGILGLIITIGLSFVFSSIPSFAGFLLPMGYGQGPGQALSVGNIFATAGMFEFGVDMGLSIAAMGFLAASIGGVVYLRKLKKQGLLPEPTESSMEAATESTILEGNGQIPLVDAVDKLTIQVAIIGFVYFLAWGVIYTLEQLILASNVTFLINNLIGLLYGFNFIIVVFMGMLYKSISRMLLRNKIMRRIYTNDFMLNRIAGFAFDVMMISSIMAIDISVVAEPGFIITLLTIGIIGGLATYGYLGLITKNVYPHYAHEAFLVFYGTMTGTASTGIALLREKDPYFKTPATNDIVYGSSMAIPLGFPLLLFVGIVYQGWLQLGIVFVTLLVIFTTYHFFLTRPKKSKKVSQSSTKVS